MNVRNTEDVIVNKADDRFISNISVMLCFQNGVFFERRVLFMLVTAVAYFLVIRTLQLGTYRTLKINDESLGSCDVTLVENCFSNMKRVSLKCRLQSIPEEPRNVSFSTRFVQNKHSLVKVRPSLGAFEEELF